MTIGFFAFKTRTFIINCASDVFTSLLSPGILRFLETPLFFKLTRVFVIPRSSSSFFSGTIGGESISHTLNSSISFRTTPIFFILQTSLLLQKRSRLGVESCSKIGLESLRLLKVILRQVDILFTLRAA